MKRLAILAILAAFILGTVATASAVELKAGGSWRVVANWLDNTDFADDDGASEDDFAVYQRARVYFDFINKILDRKNYRFDDEIEVIHIEKREDMFLWTQKM